MILDQGIVPARTELLASGLIAQSPWFAMELGGKPLSRLLPRDWDGVRDVLLQILDALACGHARGIIHRDLKPGNVLRFDDVWKLTDYGIAVEPEIDEREEPAGTVPYMAPEQIEGDPRSIGPWTDLYALGCLAFSLATSGLPFVGETLYAIAFAHLSGTRAEWTPRGALPQGLEGWIERLLRRAPGERFQRAADAAWALEQLPDVEEVGPILGRRTFEGEPSVEAEEAPTIPLHRLASDTRMLSAHTLVQEPTLPSGPPPPARPGERFTSYPPLPSGWRPPRRSRPSVAGLPGAGLGLFGLRRIPLVGRARELSLLWAALSEVRRNGGTRVAVLRGGAGFGKSRLTRWLAERADEVGSALVLSARHSRDADPGSGLGPMLSRHLKCRGLTRAEARERVSRLLESLGEPDDYEVDGLLEVLMPSREADDEQSGFAFGSPAERHRLIRRVLLRMAAGRPLVLRLEDVQHGGDALRFVEAALESGDDERGPVLVLATARDEDLGGDEQALLSALCGRPEVRELRIEALHPDEQRRLVDRLLGLSSDLGDEVARRTEGNPLFAVQVVGDWVERGVLTPTREGFRLAPGAKVSLPAGIRQVWTQRLATVLHGASADAEASLHVAAALGGEVDLLEWTIACERAGVQARMPVVDRLVDAGLAERHGLGAAAAASWSFAQTLFRETLAADAVLAGRWEACHVACVEAIEGLLAPGHRGRAARLAGHLAAASRPVEALEAWHEAATEELEVAEYARSGDALLRAEEAADAAALPESDERRGDIAYTRMTWLRHQVRLVEAERLAEAWRSRAHEHGWRRLEGYFAGDLADILHRTGRLDEAERLLDEQAEIEAAMDEAHRVEARRLRASIARIRGDLPRAAELLEGVVAWLSEHGRPAAVAGATRDLAMVRIAEGDAAEGVRLTQEARRLYEGVGFRMGVVRCSNTLGTALVSEGRTEEAIACYEEGLAVDQRIGTGLASMFALNLGMAELRRGRLAAAGERIEGYRDAFIEGPDAAFRIYWLALDLAGRIGRGDFSGWRTALDEMLGLVSDSPSGVDEDLAYPVHVAASAAFEAGQEEAATALVELAIVAWSALGKAEELAEARALRATLEVSPRSR